MALTNRVIEESVRSIAYELISRGERLLFFWRRIRFVGLVLLLAHISQISRVGAS